MKQYARRDSETLGEYYFRHVEAMTEEGLHDKSAIAGELAFRDWKIEQLINLLKVHQQFHRACPGSPKCYVCEAEDKFNKLVVPNDEEQ